MHIKHDKNNSSRHAYLDYWTPTDVVRTSLVWATLAVHAMLVLPLDELMTIVTPPCI